MDEREREPAGGDARPSQAQPRGAHVGEEEREHGGDEQLAARRGRQREDGVGAAVPGRERDQRGLRQDERDAIERERKSATPAS